MHIREFQKLIKEEYYEKDKRRGKDKTFLWFIEEIGELSEALRKEKREMIEKEMADVFAWLCSIANLLGIDIEMLSIDKYEKGCPRCGKIPCQCKE